MGESLDDQQTGTERLIMPLITSSNIACGYHAGGALQMENTIKLAKRNQVKVGAHPGYPDRAGFGRRKLDLPADELAAIIKYQLAAIKGVAESQGSSVNYVKLHGALYNQAAEEEQIASTCLKAIRAIDDRLMVVGLSGSIFEKLCGSQGIVFIPEAFADRKYESNGKLRSRALPEAVITDPELACNQAMDIIANQKVTAFDGTEVKLVAQTLCVHGDNPSAVAILEAMGRIFEQNGVVKQSFS